MRAIVPVLLVLAATACQDANQPVAPLPAGAPVLQRVPAPIPGQYIVQFHDNVAQPAILARQLAAAHGGTVRYIYEHAIKGFSLQMPDAQAAALARNPNVKIMEPNQLAYAGSPQNSPPWVLDRVDQRDLPLNGAYYYPYTGAGVRVYVLDTGVRASHNDFGGRVSHGWDTFDNDSDASDCEGHGTHVAGTIGGATYGIAKGVSMVAVRVLGCDGNAPWDVIANGVNWVTNNAVKPAVANMSIWGPASNIIDNAVRNSISSGVTYVVISGNGNASACDTSPARVSEAITVGATDTNDAEAQFSNFGSCVDILAPGVGVVSAGLASDTDVSTKSGTSMAAPQVAGAAAMYLHWRPGAMPSGIEMQLVRNASTNKITFPAGHSGSPNKLLYTRFLGFTASMSGPSTIGHAQTCSWNATASGGVAPYTYRWVSSHTGGNTYFVGGAGPENVFNGTGYYYGTSPSATTVYLTLEVTDAGGVVLSQRRNITLYNYAIGCI